MKITIKKGSLLIVMCLLYAFFRSQIYAAGLTRIVEVLMLAIACYCFFRGSSGLNIGVVFNKRLLGMQVFWIIFAILSLRNVEFELGGYFSETNVRLYLCLALIIFAPYLDKWENNVTIWTRKIGMIYVIATFVILIVPSLFSYVIDFYGAIPAGTSGGSAGYRAGIADHYSQNGIYIALTLISCAVLWMSAETKKNKQFILMGIAAFALILTTKRGVLIFSIAALMGGYVLCQRRNKLSRTFKVLGICIIILILFLILAPIIPSFAAVLDRLSAMGTDDSSAERLMLWNFAISKFKSSPIFGIGFWGFKYAYASELYSSLTTTSINSYVNAHNVYLQVLCEMGIVGFIVYMVCVASTLIYTIKMLRAVDDNEKTPLLFSLSIQIFVLLYNFTGNCLYDVVFVFQAIASAICYRYYYKTTV